MLGDTHEAHTKLTQMCLVACKMPSKQTGQKGLLLPRAPHGCSHSLGPPSTVSALKGAMKVFHLRQTCSLSHLSSQGKHAPMESDSFRYLSLNWRRLQAAHMIVALSRISHSLHSLLFNQCLGKECPGYFTNACFSNKTKQSK